MRQYDSTTDYQILREAVQKAGKDGGYLRAAKVSLVEAGISWPGAFNTNNSPEAKAIDRDCLRALREATEAGDAN